MNIEETCGAQYCWLDKKRLAKVGWPPMALLLLIRQYTVFGTCSF